MSQMTDRHEGAEQSVLELFELTNCTRTSQKMVSVFALKLIDLSD